MHSVNTSYALYYNQTYKKTGYVFRDRYKAEPIYNYKYLINCIHYIHDNPVKAHICSSMDKYEYSSYYEYLYNIGSIIPICINRFSEINSLFMDKLFEKNNIDYTFMDYVEDKKFKEKSVVISEFLKIKQISIQDISTNKFFLKELSQLLYDECGMTHQEIANEFNVSRSKITHLLKST